MDAQEHHVKDPDICLHGRCGTSETVPQRFLFGKAFFRGGQQRLRCGLRKVAGRIVVVILL
ncbi:hypothetical protein HMPREF1326_01763 [Akkermansia sp. KLE1605]|nr:hypothetical protein HMPREF1326_01763 [Akkermansia sp. KLE1605]